MKKVLIVEDNYGWQSIWKRDLQKVELLVADSIEEAKKIFSQNDDVDLIVMDACVPGDEPNTMNLVREMRKTYHGSILANSSVLKYREILLNAGCDKECHKKDVVEKILEILSLNK